MSVAALLIGKETSVGFPGKNYMQVLGRPLCVYPLLAAKHCNAVEKMFISTDSPRLGRLGIDHGAEVIERPLELARSDSPTELVFSHAYQEIRCRMGGLDYLFLMFANSADVTPELMSKAHQRMEADTSLDAVISVSKYNMFAPMRARRVSSDGVTKSMMDELGISAEDSFNRDAMGDVFFTDFGVQLVRPERCLLDTEAGVPPFKWLGQKQGALVKEFGFDVDQEWQVPVIEFWLRNHGFAEGTTPYDR